VGRLPAKIGSQAVVIDPRQPEHIYTVADDGRVYRSDDAGRSWNDAGRGLPGEGVVALTLDPRQPTRLYAATASAVLYASEDGARSWRVLGHMSRDGAR